MSKKNTSLMPYVSEAGLKYLDYVISEMDPVMENGGNEEAYVTRARYHLLKKNYENAFNDAEIALIFNPKNELAAEILLMATEKCMKAAAVRRECFDLYNSNKASVMDTAARTSEKSHHLTPPEQSTTNCSSTFDLNSCNVQNSTVNHDNDPCSDE